MVEHVQVGLSAIFITFELNRTKMFGPIRFRTRYCCDCRFIRGSNKDFMTDLQYSQRSVTHSSLTRWCSLLNIQYSVSVYSVVQCYQLELRKSAAVLVWWQHCGCSLFIPPPARPRICIEIMCEKWRTNRKPRAAPPRHATPLPLFQPLLYRRREQSTQ